MNSLVEPRWPPGLEVLKVSASGRWGVPRYQRETGPAFRTGRRRPAWPRVPPAPLCSSPSACLWAAVSWGLGPLR